MGYIAYAAGTLIGAAVVHLLVKHVLGDSKNRDGQPHHVTASKNATFRLQIKDTATPSVDNKFDDHDANPSFSIENVDDQISSEEPGQTKLSKESADEVVSPKPVRLPQVQPLDMPPPPRPSSAPDLNKTTASRSMPPPSSLPPSRNRSPPRLKPATSSLAPPSRGPPARSGGFVNPTGFSNAALTSQTAPKRTTTIAAARSPAGNSLGVPQQKVLANTHMQPSLSSALAPTTSTQAPEKRSSRKVMLSPGHSPLDWAALTKSTAADAPQKLRGNDATGSLGLFRLGRITPSQLKKQTGRKGKDAWTTYQGRVYNISAYLDFHPGGRDELMKGAGRSSDKLFAEVHPWVNWEGMLGGCLVGMLVTEDDPQALGREEEVENELDEMD